MKRAEQTCPGGAAANFLMPKVLGGKHSRAVISTIARADGFNKPMVIYISAKTACVYFWLLGSGKEKE